MGIGYVREVVPRQRNCLTLWGGGDKGDGVITPSQSGINPRHGGMVVYLANLSAYLLLNIRVIDITNCAYNQ